MAKAFNGNGALRLPLLWLLGAALTIALPLLASIPPMTEPDASLHDTYYVVTRPSLYFSFLVLFLFFALAYGAMGQVRHKPYRQPLAYSHFGLTLIGTLLILSVPVVINVAGLAGSYEDPSRSFALANTAMSAGYGLVLVAQLIFVTVLVDAYLIRRRPA